ncbi:MULTISPECIES: sigma-70 family RNA polymerase sigma factor [unclassified Mucilaginibacter]|uniref:RNA polymerase sigma factor n=1 Tax=unclassified Mucilaginibacter TaxID=2617802 RepID=UPI002AC8C6EA|nr:MULTISPECIES: sigma-70 family RNA polymerase sigma factor [unclassified Mucilaginibacter]MEB0263110.1 sigma-70 family RNA polymerase sigma factor [Mucilaginibacter sp. 10I4]MEB0277754.1 sigma-70 family RNA polymerase sigma factor [Mucilaginibacter sp. 10B2]MEB0303273.1 sigma-70 family RNA polymerase sigma factor [Mucilaginibacter sp. 5C4]WPX24621.1 sigma-70 family RNA polymerase sigma factor [Mucilaginibacter sp. 5C4]
MGEEELHQLVKGCLKDDRLCQKLLYKAFYGFAIGICLRYANNRYEASEIMNQGFYKVFKNLVKYDLTKPFKAWLGRIMVNTSIDYYRSNLKIAYTEELDKAEHVNDTEFADRNLNYNELLDMISQLPRAYRTIFNLFAIEGYTHEEIGTMLNISTGTSKSNLHKAREKLKIMIANSNKMPGTASKQANDNIVLLNHKNTPNLSISFINNVTKR